jgi:transposase
LKAYITGFVRSGNTYTANGAAEMIKEIMSYLKDEVLEITFRMDSGYFDDDIIATIESFECTYVIKGKEYPTLVSQVTAPSISFIKVEEGRETTELVTKLDTWDKDRRFVVSRVLKPTKDRPKLPFLEGSNLEYFYFVTKIELSPEKVVIVYEKRGNVENYIYNMAVGTLFLQSLWPMKPYFS